jgi:NADH-quinone oxidoreductase subunit I
MPDTRPQTPGTRPAPAAPRRAGGPPLPGAPVSGRGTGFTSAVREITSGFYSLITGMRVTLAEFFKPTITVQYPHESLKMPSRFRGHIELVRDEASGMSLCIACKSCEKACPSACIYVDGIKREGEKRKSPTEFTLDFTRCSLCGSCVEVCPTDALQYSRDYNLASTRKDEYLYDLLKRLQAEKK